MDIVVSFDSNYLMPVGVMLTSLFENNKGIDINVHALLSSVGDYEQPVREIVEAYGGNLYCYDMSRVGLPDLPINKNHRAHLTIESFYRLFITEVLPPNIEKVLWLDGDIIVNKSLNDLWSEDISGYAVGAVPDYENNNVRICNRLGYGVEYGYFNAGVLLINLQYWRANGVLYDFKEYIKEHFSDLWFFDQDVLNPVFHKNKKDLSISYNFQTTFLFKNLNISCCFFDEIRNAYIDPVIIHFNEDKPWFSNSTNPMKMYFIKYQNMTIWKGKDKGRRKLSVRARLARFYSMYKAKSWSYTEALYNIDYL